MATFGEALAAIRAFRNDLVIQAQLESENDTIQLLAARREMRSHGAIARAGGLATTFAARGGVAAFATPLSNVHATGVGIRTKGDRPVPGEFVLKVYVFEKVDLGEAAPLLTSQPYRGVPVDVEHLPIQRALARKKAKSKAQKDHGRTASVQTGVGLVAAPASVLTLASEVVLPEQQRRIRPVIGGLSAAPLGASFVGTVGGFLRGVVGRSERIYALSNNHVFAATDSLGSGTLITQPGPEIAPTTAEDVFAVLTMAVPILFPGSSPAAPVANRYDAAIAHVTDPTLIKRATISGVPNYTAELSTPVPGMRVVKSGRTTGVTRGTIHAIGVNGVQVNYGTQLAPRIARFDDTIEIVGDGPEPFSLPGDSGSFILEEESGRPVALLFAGDGVTTTACDLGGICRQFQAIPV